MISANLLWFLAFLILGVIGNAFAFRDKAFSSWGIWFWNVGWLFILRSSLG